MCMRREMSLIHFGQDVFAIAMKNCALAESQWMCVYVDKAHEREGCGLISKNVDLLCTRVEVYQVSRYCC